MYGEIKISICDEKITANDSNLNSPELSITPSQITVLIFFIVCSNLITYHVLFQNPMVKCYMYLVFISFHRMIILLLLVLFIANQKSFGNNICFYKHCVKDEVKCIDLY